MPNTINKLKSYHLFLILLLYMTWARVIHLFYLPQAINIFLIFMYLLVCTGWDHFWSQDLPPTLAAAWLQATRAYTGSLLPHCAQLCPGLWGNQGLSHTHGTHCPTVGWHPLPVSGQDSQGQDTLAVVWSSRVKCMPVALLLGPAHCMLSSGRGSICYQGWAVFVKPMP